MMDTLDSRFLRSTNCFAQKFPVEGEFRYALVTASCLVMSDEDRPFTIQVRRQKSDKATQHNVTVKLEGRNLVADPPKLEISAGDLVLWNAPETRTPGFVVAGEGKGFRFDSSALETMSLYTHAFGLPGTYEWVDANGSKVGGVVEVVNPESDTRAGCQKWLKSLNSGTLIHVVGETAKPAKVQINTGQTVFWAVEKTPGITITDRRLVQRQPAKRDDHQPDKGAASKRKKSR